MNFEKLSNQQKIALAGQLLLDVANTYEGDDRIQLAASIGNVQSDFESFEQYRNVGDIDLDKMISSMFAAA